MKKAVHYIFLALWLFTVAVPSLVTIFDQSEKPVLVVNLNDEEQQEQSKTDSEEKQIICTALLTHSSTMAFGDANRFGDFLSLHGDLTQEIPLPPPESIF